MSQAKKFTNTNDFKNDHYISIDQKSDFVLRRNAQAKTNFKTVRLLSEK